MMYTFCSRNVNYNTTLTIIKLHFNSLIKILILNTNLQKIKLYVYE